MEHAKRKKPVNKNRQIYFATVNWSVFKQACKDRRLSMASVVNALVELLLAGNIDWQLVEDKATEE